MILKLSDIKRYCQRQSYRTTDILYECRKFLEGPESRKTVVVITHNQSMVGFFTEQLRDSFDLSVTRMGYIQNASTGNIVIITTLKSVKMAIIGRTIHDVYFDCPEYDVFKREEFGELLAHMRNE